MIVLETDRLRLAHLDDTDAAFMLALLNTPAWLRYIGDRYPRIVVEEAGPTLVDVARESGAV